jgi:hypothetical protein
MDAAEISRQTDRLRRETMDPLTRLSSDAG